MTEKHFRALPARVEQATHEISRLANDNVSGLAASAWSWDSGRAMRAGRDLNFGSVWINDDHLVLSLEIPQGGFGSSGFGKEGGLPGLAELTRLNQVSASLL